MMIEPAEVPMRRGKWPLASALYRTIDVLYATYYSTSVIRSFSDGRTRRLFEEDRRRGFGGLDYERAVLASRRAGRRSISRVAQGPTICTAPRTDR